NVCADSGQTACGPYSAKVINNTLYVGGEFGPVASPVATVDDSHWTKVCCGVSDPTGFGGTGYNRNNYTFVTDGTATTPGSYIFAFGKAYDVSPPNGFNEAMTRFSWSDGLWHSLNPSPVVPVNSIDASDYTEVLQDPTDNRVLYLT